MGGAEKVKRQHDAGRPTVRERIDGLLDENSFHEIGAIAGRGRNGDNGEIEALQPANFVFGRGRIDGRPVVIGGDDFTVRGGAADAAIWQKQVMSEQMANELRLPSYGWSTAPAAAARSRPSRPTATPMCRPTPAGISSSTTWAWCR